MHLAINILIIIGIAAVTLFNPFISSICLLAFALFFEHRTHIAFIVSCTVHSLYAALPALFFGAGYETTIPGALLIFLVWSLKYAQLRNISFVNASSAYNSGTKLISDLIKAVCAVLFITFVITFVQDSLIENIRKPGFINFYSYGVLSFYSGSYLLFMIISSLVYLAVSISAVVRCGCKISTFLKRMGIYLLFSFAMLPLLWLIIVNVAIQIENLLIAVILIAGAIFGLKALLTGGGGEGADSNADAGRDFDSSVGYETSNNNTPSSKAQNKFGGTETPYEPKSFYNGGYQFYTYDGTKVIALYEENRKSYVRKGNEMRVEDWSLPKVCDASDVDNGKIIVDFGSVNDVMRKWKTKGK